MEAAQSISKSISLAAQQQKIQGFSEDTKQDFEFPFDISSLFTSRKKVGNATVQVKFLRILTLISITHQKKFNFKNLAPDVVCLAIKPIPQFTARGVKISHIASFAVIHGQDQ